MALDKAVNNVRIVTSDKIIYGSVGIKGEKIAEIREGKELNAEIIINGKDKYLFPGIIDNHVHLNDPGYTWREDFLHGTSAAAIGGVTTLVDMPMQNEPAVSNSDIYARKAETLSTKGVVDYSFWGALVDYNFSDLEGLRKCGVKAFKSFMSPVGSDYTSLGNGQIREALKILRELDGIGGFHCEDYDIIAYEESKAINEGRLSIKDYLKARPVAAELIATKNVIDLAKEQGANIHICHVSHGKIADIIKRAKEENVNITSETCPHYLVFSAEDVIKKGLIYKCSPPIREKENIDSMWEAVRDGTLDCIVSDHSPSRIDEKDAELGAFKAWGGISGLQTGLQVVFHEGVNNRHLSPTFIARTMAENPAKIFGFGDKKGKIKIGYDADMVLLDPDALWKIKENDLAYLNKFSAFCGLEGKGLPIMTLVRGKVVAEYGNIKVDGGYGRLIKVKTKTK